VFNVMPCLGGIRGGEGSRHRIRTQLKCPAAVLAPPRKRGHQRLLFISIYTIFPEMQIPFEGAPLDVRSVDEPAGPSMAWMRVVPSGHSAVASPDPFLRLPPRPGPLDGSLHGNGSCGIRRRTARQPGDYSRAVHPEKTLPYLSGFLDSTGYRRYNLPPAGFLPAPTILSSWEMDPPNRTLS
jgi:hypothetical protein